MRFRFEEQEHQKEAVRAIVDALESAAVQTTAGTVLDPDALLTGVRGIQSRNRLDPDDALRLLDEQTFAGERVRFPNLSVEMETGTGKTYTYIRTALSLAKAIGARRFVIVVPSIAIREGVAKTFEMTREHFATHEDFSEQPYDWAVYRSTLPHLIEDFVRPSTEIRFLITTLASFNRADVNRIFRQPETMQLWSSDRTASPMERLQRLRAVLILDEPQNMGSPLSRQALATLHPLVALRYSATHMDTFNMVYRLGPAEARRQQLVKRVAVRGVQPGLDPNIAFLRLDAVTMGRRRGAATATVTALQVTAVGDVREQRLVVRPGDDMAERTGRDVYEGYVVDEIRRGSIRFENGQERAIGEVAAETRSSVWRDQLYHTVRLHVERQAELDSAGVNAKVLSLVFVQRVADYDGPDAPLPALFDAEYRRVFNQRAEVAPADPASVRTAYFARTARGDSRDTAGLAADEDLESRAFDLIMRDKERLLSRDEPASFVFSHSALAEGWDNPNVFQICFLRHAQSPVQRRQQVGRGLRLPVTQEGERVRDDTVNRLTLVVDESYEDFVAALNAEYAAATGYRGGGGGEDQPDVDNDALSVRVGTKPEKLDSDEFERLWGRIRFRTRYRLDIDSHALVEAFARETEWDELRALGRTRNIVVEAELEAREGGFIAGPERALRTVGGTAARVVLPDLLGLLEANLHDVDPRLTLTRRTLGRLLAAVPIPETAIWSPEQWAAAVARRIRSVAAGQLVDGIRYELLPEAEWWEARVVLRDAYLAYRSTPSATRGVMDTLDPSSPNLYTHVDYDSLPERRFAEWLEASELVRFYIRLPRTFDVPTPVGTYSPDFAIVADHPDRGEVVYLVQEVKHSLAELGRRDAENLRIRYARRHFGVAPERVEFEVATGESGMRTSPP